MLLLHTAVLCVASLVTAAPKPQGYGGVQPPAPAPSRQVSCRVEYTTAWDTEYRETESQECVTQYQQQCSTRIERQCQPTTRQEKRFTRLAIKNGCTHPICLYSCHSILCYKLLEAHFTVSGNKMTITNKILTNQRR